MLHCYASLENQTLEVEGESVVKDNELAKVKTDVSLNETDTDEEVELAAGDEPKNPLQNPVILRNLFNLCPAPILASCRRVCKLWYDESLVTWRAAVPLQVTANGTDIRLGRNATPFHNFLEFVNEPGRQCSLKPYRNVILGLFVDSYRFHPVDDIFWEAVGSNLSTLEIDFYKFGGVSEFRQIIYKSCPNLINLIIKSPLMLKRSRKDRINWLEYKEPVYGEHKNLKFLHLELETSTGGQLPVSWTELFSHFPSLTAFKFYYASNNPYPLCGKLMDAIRIIRKHDKNKLPFKSFDYFPTFKISCGLASARNFAVIRELHLPLNKIDIVVNPKIGGSLLTESLSYLSNSIKWINLVNPKEDEHLDQAPIPTQLIRNFPFGIQLDNLRNLRMQNDFCESLVFIKYTPNLAFLCIYDSKRKYYNKSRTTIVSNTSMNVKMSRLESFYLDFIVTDNDLQKLFNWMPNMRNLKMVLNDKQFGMVCENWRNLKQLEVFGQELTNRGVAGIEEGEGTKKADLCPNISKLSSLERFQYDTGKLTVNGVLHVLLQLPNLRILERWGVLTRCSGSINLCRRLNQDNVTASWRREKGLPMEEEDDEEEDDEDWTERD